MEYTNLLRLLKLFMALAALVCEHFDCDQDDHAPPNHTPKE